MYCMDFSKPQRVHFIGIGGISMSGLAVILMHNGFAVSGSDAHPGETTDKLAAMGARIYTTNAASNLDEKPDVVVYTAAIHPDNPEYSRCVQLGIPMLTRAQLLGQIMQNYHTAIGVSGTHGKTTTSSMLAHILINAHMLPTISVGGMLEKISGNIHVDTGDVFLTEACEYTNSFLSLHPTMEVILNVEADHLDFFKDIDDIRSSFRKYIQLLPADGTLVIGSDIDRLFELTDGCACKNIVTFGMNQDISDYSCKNVRLTNGHHSFDVCAKSSRYDGMNIELSVPGLHNVSNALAAIAAADKLGVKPDVLAYSMKEFCGAHRRFEFKGSADGVNIVDDYAHHPQEISATLSAAAQYPHKRMVVIFQPHTYTRTKALFDEFAKSLSAADEVILAKIYPARETDTLGVSSAQLSEAVRALGTPSVSFDSFEEITDYAREHCKPGDLLITMGAGDVVKIGEMLLKG